MSISRFVCVAALLALTAAGCVAPSSGDNCDPCESDTDCNQGKICAEFEGGEWLCADNDTQECTVTI